MAPLGPFEPAPRVAVAVSGGSDSLALCLLADRWARARGGAVFGLTVDHRLRPESGAEAAQVRRWLAARAISHRTLRWTGTRPVSGIQEEARAARLALLVGWCRRAHVLHLLLGHQREDQAETVLQRLVRGSGIDGLAAMAPVRLAMEPDGGGVRLLRPLLSVSRDALTASLALLGTTLDRRPDQSRHLPYSPAPGGGAGAARAGRAERRAAGQGCRARRRGSRRAGSALHRPAGRLRTPRARRLRDAGPMHLASCTAGAGAARAEPRRHHGLRRSSSSADGASGTAGAAAARRYRQGGNARRLSCGPAKGWTTRRLQGACGSLGGPFAQGGRQCALGPPIRRLTRLVRRVGAIPSAPARHGRSDPGPRDGARRRQAARNRLHSAARASCVARAIRP